MKCRRCLKDKPPHSFQNTPDCRECRRAQLRADTLVEYVEKRIQKGTPDTCWPWQGWHDSFGYGKGAFGGYEFRAHRAVYEIHHGPLTPEKPIVRHTCDNPTCCNPSHLVAGTKRDNHNDSIQRKRWRPNHMRRYTAPQKLERPQLIAESSATLADYFWKYTTPKDPDSCWLWQGSVNPNGYGIGCFKYKRQGAHVIAYIVCIGPVPDGQYVLHTCDTRLCVNPAHLQLGSSRDNTIDAYTKGRRGRVTPDEVRELRRLRAEGWSLRKLAAHFNLPYSTVNYIARGLSYSYIE